MDAVPTLVVKAIQPVYLYAKAKDTFCQVPTVMRMDQQLSYA